jgi:hypothetical protein
LPFISLNIRSGGGISLIHRGFVVWALMGKANVTRRIIDPQIAEHELRFFIYASPQLFAPTQDRSSQMRGGAVGPGLCAAAQINRMFVTVQKHAVPRSGSMSCSMAHDRNRSTGELPFQPRISVPTWIEDAMALNPTGIIHAISDVAVIGCNAIAKINVCVARNIHYPNQLPANIEFYSAVTIHSFTFSQNYRIGITLGIAPSNQRQRLQPTRGQRAS